MRIWKRLVGLAVMHAMAAHLSIVSAQPSSPEGDALLARFKGPNGELLRPDIPLFVQDGGAPIMMAGNYPIASYFRLQDPITLTIGGSRVELQKTEFGPECTNGAVANGVSAYVFVNAPPTSQFDRAGLYTQFGPIAERLLDTFCSEWRGRLQSPGEVSYSVYLKFFYSDLYLDQDWNLHVGPTEPNAYYPQFAYGEFSWRSRDQKAIKLKDGFDAFKPVIHGFRGAEPIASLPYVDIPNFNFLQAIDLLKRTTVPPRLSLAIAQLNEAQAAEERKRHVDRLRATVLPGVAITMDRGLCHPEPPQAAAWWCVLEYHESSE